MDQVSLSFSRRIPLLEVQTGPRIKIFVVKVASRCNLSCTYCYMYHHADQSWQQQPHFMSRDTIARLSDRLNEHAKTFDARPRFLVVAHGGEPLLYPHLDEFLDMLHTSVAAADVMFAIQT